MYIFFDWNGDGQLIHRNAGDPSSNLGGPTTLSSNKLLTKIKQNF